MTRRHWWQFWRRKPKPEARPYATLDATVPRREWWGSCGPTDVRYHDWGPPIYRWVEGVGLQRDGDDGVNR